MFKINTSSCKLTVYDISDLSDPTTFGKWVYIRRGKSYDYGYNFNADLFILVTGFGRFMLCHRLNDSFNYSTSYDTFDDVYSRCILIREGVERNGI